MCTDITQCIGLYHFFFIEWTLNLTTINALWRFLKCRFSTLAALQTTVSRFQRVITLWPTVSTISNCTVHNCIHDPFLSKDVQPHRNVIKKCCEISAAGTYPQPDIVAHNVIVGPKIWDVDLNTNFINAASLKLGREKLIKVLIPGVLDTKTATWLWDYIVKCSGNFDHRVYFNVHWYHTVHGGRKRSIGKI